MNRSVALPFLAAAVCLLAAAIATPVAARPADPSPGDTGVVEIVYTHDGSRLVGRVVCEDSAAVTLATEYGRVIIPREAIASRRRPDPVPDGAGRYRLPDPNRTRLFFAPTARMLPQGTGYFQNIYLFFNGVAVGLTDHITIGGGMSFFPSDDFFDNNIFYLTPKVGTTVDENLDIAAGLLWIEVPGDDPDGLGIAYGVATVGSERASLTGGLGWGFADGRVTDSPLVMLGGMVRVSNRIALVTENWKIPEVDEVGFSWGLRFIGESLSADLGFVNATGSDIFPGIPYVDFVVNF